VIGNPPYVAKTFEENFKTYLRTSYATSQYQLDLYISFIEKGIKILTANGKISFITPNSWLKNMMFTELRKYLLTKVFFLKILPNLENVFEEASVNTMIFIASKNKTAEGLTVLHLLGQNIVVKHQANQNSFTKNNRFIFDVEVNNASRSIIERIRSGSIKHEVICDITRGVNPYDKYTGQDAQTIKNKLYHSTIKKDDSFVPEIRGKHLGNYYYKWDGSSYISYGPWLAAPREKKYFEGERLVMRQVLSEKLVCTVIEEQIIIDQSVFISKIKDEYSRKIKCKYLLALFASKLYAYYFKLSNNEFDALFPKIKIGEFKELPVKLIDITEQQPFITLVDQILLAKKENPHADTSTLEKQIDLMVYHLYDLTYDEVKLIDETVSKEEYTL
jgi:hypothetical protein